MNPMKRTELDIMPLIIVRLSIPVNLSMKSVKEFLMMHTMDDIINVTIPN
jgi:hypothetical protein